MVRSRYIRITLYIFIMLAFTAFPGCSKNEVTPQTSYEIKAEETLETTEQVYLDEPDISISAMIDLETWSAPVTDGSAAIPANAHSFTLQLKFKEELDTESIYNALHVSNSKTPIIRFSQDCRSVDIYFDSIELVKQYEVLLSTGLKGADGHSLKSDVKVSILPKEQVKARYKVSSSFGELYFPDGTTPGAIGGEEEQLTNEPKKIEISFTDDIDKKAVEDVIKKSIKTVDAEYTMEWKDDRTIVLDFLKFKSNTYYKIMMSDVIGKNKLPICNNMYFYVLPPNELYSYDLASGTSTLIKSFHDKRYDVIENMYHGQYWLLADQENGYIYDSNADKIINAPEKCEFPKNMGLHPIDAKLITWFDKDVPLYYQRKKNIITACYLSNGETETIVDLNKYMDKKPVFPQGAVDIKVSPDKTKLAVAVRLDKNEDFENNESSIWVFSISGEKLYETPRIKNARSYWVSGGNILILNLCWLNNDELVYETGYSVDEKKETGVACTNIKSGDTRMIAQKAINPVSFPPAEQVTVCRYETEPQYPKFFQVITKDGVVSEFVKRAKPYYGMRLMGGLKIVYYEGRNDSGDGFYDYMYDIIIYDCTAKQEKVIQGAQIVGSSSDGRELYYMTNQKFLIPIS